MQTDPALEWRRLAEHYREIGDDELRELAADFSDLTETAQQVLAQEMRSRGLADPRGTSPPPQFAKTAVEAAEFPLRAGKTPADPDSITTHAASVLGVRSPQLAAACSRNSGGRHRRFWRTRLYVEDLSVRMRNTATGSGTL
jgi:hypothetical protein